MDVQDLRGHRRRGLLRGRRRHPPLRRIQHPHARALQDLRAVSPPAEISRLDLPAWGLGFVVREAVWLCGVIGIWIPWWRGRILEPHFVDLARVWCLEVSG